MKASFNNGWEVRPKVSSFLELTGTATAPFEAVMLPHDAMLATTRDPDGDHMNAYFPAGAWKYVKTFDVPSEWRDRCVHVQFEGVYRDAMVFVNDDFAAVEPNGYREFAVALDPFLRYGESNTIRVECRAGDDSRWYSGAGIYRPVHLWVQPRVRVALDGVSITTPEIDDAGAVVEVVAEVANGSPHTARAHLTCELTDPTGVVVASGTTPVSLRPGEESSARLRMYVDGPQRWSLEDPALYTCTTTMAQEPEVGADRHVSTFGIRTLQLDSAHGLRVNGAVVKLRGACVHHDNGPIGSATFARAEERRVERLKQAGFNAIRSAHNPASRALLDACDRLGVLVMDEAWDMWTENKRDQDHALRFADRWRDDIEAMVRKDRNHPSVVMYSTGNEIPEVGSPLGAARAREIAEHVRSLDPARYVTNAVQPLLAIRDLIGRIRDFAQSPEAAAALAELGSGDDAPQGVNSQMAAFTAIKDRLLETPLVDETIEEVCASIDVAGYNYLDVRYVGDHDLHPDRVIVGSETYVTALGQAWPLVEAHPHLIGDFTWTGWDYLGEVGIGRTEYVEAGDGSVPTEGVVGEYPWLVAHAGDIDITGVRRPASYYREIVFGRRTDPYIAVHRPANAGKQIAYAGPWSWSDSIGSWSWSGFEGTVVKVEVYADADDVELLLDGESLGRRPAGREHDFRAEFAVTCRPGELVAVGYRDGREVGRTALPSSVGPSRLRVVPERSEIELAEGELAYVAVSISDADGVIDTSADCGVAVAVDGPGELVAFASADPRATDPFRTPMCRTHDGRALAVVRPTGEGSITISVSADNFATTTTEVVITATKPAVVEDPR